MGGGGGLIGGLLDVIGLGPGKPPKVPALPPPPTLDEKKAKTAGAASAIKKKKMAAAAYGSLDTIVAGNLGSVGASNLQTSTLLGSA